jgi:hypothetical protein
MHRYLLCGFYVLSFFIFAGQACDRACAWQFSLEGNFTSTYEYYSQQGAEGFFGKANTDRSAGTAGSLGLKPGDFASLNGWVGKRAKDLVSGADSSQQYPVLEFFPEIRVNSAIRFRGKYRLGDYGDPNASDYFTNTRPGVDVATSDGQWTLWWITAQTPWGILVVGKRPEEFGTGLQYDGTRNTTGEGVLLVSDYGPFRLALAFQPFWQESPNQRLGMSSSPYYNLLDKSGIRQQSTRAFMTYRSGPLDFGTTYMVFRWHAGPESQNLEASRITFVPYDDIIRHGCIYMKYSNGMVFLNGEAAYWNESINLVGRAPLYNESWRGMVESGIVCGPGKVSFLYTFMPGADRRNGALIDRQPYIQGGPNAAAVVFQPYSYLLAYAYGAGVNAFDLDRNGYINEAWVLAARIDYSVAANLNIFGSFLWAERSSHGHGWGFIRPAQKFTVTRTVNSGGNGADQVQWTPYVNYKDNPNAPSIPDNSLGWEVMAGMDWKLLDKLQVSILGSFWQPGKWFNYACIDKNVASWDLPTAANRWGTNPGRSIDPVVGTQIILSTEF